MLLKKKNSRFGRYPCCDMLNNALRFLRDEKIDSATREIIFAIQKADGYFYEDLKPFVDETMEKWKEEHVK